MELLPKTLEIAEFERVANLYNLTIFSSNFEICRISCFDSINKTSHESISFLRSPDELSISVNACLGLVLISEEYRNHSSLKNFKCKLLYVDNPKYFFAALLNVHFKSAFQEETSLVSVNGAGIDSSAQISKYAFIEKGAVIGRNSVISAGVYISSATSIGDNTKIGVNSVLGGVGFGFAVRKGYAPLRIPHFGSLQIGNNVEIGSGTHIDRGTFSTTLISNDVKIDNGVHIAHNVVIGARTLVIAHAEISGSVEIGEDCWIAPNVSIKEKVRIGNNVLVGIGSVVLRDIDSDQVVVGIPARPIGERN